MRLGKKAPALTVSQVRTLLAVLLPLRTYTVAEALALVAWVQRRNHRAYLSHRKRRGPWFRLMSAARSRAIFRHVTAGASQAPPQRDLCIVRGSPCHGPACDALLVRGSPARPRALPPSHVAHHGGCPLAPPGHGL